MALRLKMIGGTIFIILILLSYFIEGLRNQPFISIIMITSLIVCALGFYIERRKKWVRKKEFIKMEKST